jgi:hypothetical protein
MRQGLIDHFGNPSNIEHEEFRGRYWQGEDCDQGIQIEMATRWRPEITQKRPAVIIKRNDWSYIKRGTFDNTSGNTLEGDRRHTKFGRGSHTVFAVCGEDAEAEILGSEIQRFLMHFSPVFRQYFNLLMYEVVQLGQPHEIEECNEHWTVPVTVMYAWDETWILREAAPPLTKIRLSQILQIGN